MIQKIDHIGIAVRSLEDSIPLYEKAYGLPCQRIEEVESQQVKVAFFEVGEVHIELLEPTGESSPIARFLEKKGEGIHHIAFATDDISQQLSQARDAGVTLIHKEPFLGAGEKLVAFLHPSSTGKVLTEFCQCKK